MPLSIRAARLTGLRRLSAAGAASGSADETAPTISSTSPTDDATGVAVDAAIQITFSENVSFQAGSTIILRRKPASVFQNFETYSTTSQGGSLNGTISITDNVLTITPGVALSNGLEYAVRIASNAIKDAAGNFFGGIANDTTLSWTVVAGSNLAITYGPIARDNGTSFDYYIDPSVATGGDGSSGDPWATFDEALTARAGSTGGTVGVRATAEIVEQINLASYTDTTTPLVFKSYSTETPVWTGATTLTGWTAAGAGDTQLGGNFSGRYYKDISALSTGDTSVFGLIENGTPMPVARVEGAGSTRSDLFTSDRAAMLTASATNGLVNALAYVNKTGDFTVGQTVTGGTSGATGTIDEIVEDPRSAFSYLVLSSVSGIFTDETITDPITGSATADVSSNSAATGVIPNALRVITDTVNLDGLPASISQAYVRYVSTQELSPTGIIDSYDDGADTITISWYGNGSTVRPANDPVNYMLTNTLWNIQQGQFAVEDRGGGTWRIWCYPNDSANLTANMEYAARDGMIVLGDSAAAHEWHGFTFQFIRVGDATNNSFVSTTGTNTPEGFVVRDCTFQGEFGYPRDGTMVDSVDDVINCTFKWSVDNFGVTWKRLGAYILVEEAEHSPFRNFNCSGWMGAFCYAKNCGDSAHSNAINWYGVGQTISGVCCWGFKWENCKGYITPQDAEGVFVAFPYIYGESGVTDGRCFADQISGITSETGKDSWIVNPTFIPNAVSGTSRIVVGDSGDSNDMEWTVLNAIVEAIEDQNVTDPQLTATGGNVVTSIVRQGATDVVVADTDIFTDPSSDDYSFVDPSEVGRTGDSIEAFITALKAEFPNFTLDGVDFTDYDANGILLTPSAPHIGAVDPGVAFTPPTTSLSLGSVQADGTTNWSATFTPSAAHGVANWKVSTTTTAPTDESEFDAITAADSGTTAVFTDTDPVVVSGNSSLTISTEYTLHVEYVDGFGSKSYVSSSANAIDTSPVLNPNNIVDFTGTYGTVDMGGADAAEFVLAFAPYRTATAGLTDDVYLFSDGAGGSGNSQVYLPDGTSTLNARPESNTGSGSFISTLTWSPSNPSSVTLTTNPGDTASILMKFRHNGDGTFDVSVTINGTEYTASGSMAGTAFKMPAYFGNTNGSGANSVTFGLKGGMWFGASALAGGAWDLVYSDFFNASTDVPEFNQSTIGGVTARFYETGDAAAWAANATVSLNATPADV